MDGRIRVLGIPLSAKEYERVNEHAIRISDIWNTLTIQERQKIVRTIRDEIE